MSTIEEFNVAKKEAEQRITAIVNVLSREYGCAVDVSIDRFGIEQMGDDRRYGIYKVSITGTF